MYNKSNEEAQLFACADRRHANERERIIYKEKAQNERGEVASPTKSHYYSYVENFPGPISFRIASTST